MANLIKIKNKIKRFNKKIIVPGDKSLSIRWVLFSSLASGKSKAHNILISEDVLAAINAVKKLGLKVILKDNICTIFGKGMNGFNYKKNLKIIQNSINLILNWWLSFAEKIIPSRAFLFSNNSLLKCSSTA